MLLSKESHADVTIWNIKTAFNGTTFESLVFKDVQRWTNVCLRLFLACQIPLLFIFGNIYVIWLAPYCDKPKVL
jgi:hypothetical protein